MKWTFNGFVEAARWANRKAREDRVRQQTDNDRVARWNTNAGWTRATDDGRTTVVQTVGDIFKVWRGAVADAAKYRYGYAEA